MERDKDLNQKYQNAPRLPGVYIMRDADGKIIYVGKANDLKSRIASYFTGRDTRPMAPFLMSRVADLEFITTTTTKEALILENNLIKKHRPRYNVILRDDKTYYHLCLDPNERFPRLQLVRKRLQNAALYFGPYPSGLAAKETLRFAQRVFPLRTCRNSNFELRSRPCLEYQMGRCFAPCKGLIDESDYRKLVDHTVSFLQGRRRELVSDLKRQMQAASADLNFEQAARLRDRIDALNHALEKQHVEGADQANQDVLGVFAADDVYALCLLIVRQGKLTGSHAFLPVESPETLPDVVAAAIVQHYDADIPIPDELILPCALPDEAVIAEWLTDIKGARVTLTAPVRGAKKALLDMACANAREQFVSMRRRETQKADALLLLQEKLSLTMLPKRMECFDISNIGGKNAVGSMVVFVDGEPFKAGYRRYRILGQNEPDDYAMMREVLTRRLSGDEPLPDLWVVDGGKGQLNVALAVLKDLNVRLDVIGLAKEERFLPAGRTTKAQDRVYLPGRKDAIFLSVSPSALRLLQQIRDEAHRFAVSYHRRVKKKNDFLSILDTIPDIGPHRRTALLEHFDSARQVQSATLAELQAVPGIGPELAQKIHQTLQQVSKDRA